MTFTDQRPGGTTAPAGATPARAAAAEPTATHAGPAAHSPFEQCDRCQAPIDDQQRYCVVCGTHQRRPDDPVARYFAAARRTKATPAPLPTSQKRTVPTSFAAALIALLPVAAGVGILVGRGSADSSDAVIEALKATRVTQGVAAAGATTTAAGAATTDAASTDAAEPEAKDAGEKVEGIDTSEKQAPVIASGPTGNARQLEGTRPTKTDIEESKKAVDQINRRKGKEYIDQQRDLPDVIVIP